MYFNRILPANQLMLENRAPAAGLAVVCGTIHTLVKALRFFVQSIMLMAHPLSVFHLYTKHVYNSGFKGTGIS